MRLVFMGTPAFAVPTLERLLESGHEVALVVTQPDRPAGRGRTLVPPPVKTVALSRGVAVIQPQRLREEAAARAIEAAAPEAIVVAAFGQILPRRMLELPPHGCLNVHASLLPRWRGAAPISAAILAGDEITGVTIMLMDAGLDTGPLLAQARAAILPADTAGSLGQRLAALGADLLVETLPRWARREVAAVPQDESLATYAPQLRKEDGLLDWHRPAEELWRRCRAFSPWPGAFTHWRGLLLKVVEAAPHLDLDPPGEPGRVRLVDAAVARARALYPQLLPERGDLLVATAGAGALALLRVQLQGGRPVTGEALARGHRDLPGARLGT